MNVGGLWEKDSFPLLADETTLPLIAASPSFLMDRCLRLIPISLQLRLRMTVGRSSLWLHKYILYSNPVNGITAGE